MAKRIEYKPGQFINKIKFIKEIEPKVRKVKDKIRRERRGLFSCNYCDNVFESTFDDVKRGHVKSCGCYNPGNTKHGFVKENRRLYGLWYDMKRRTDGRIKGDAYINYFLKGIKVCDEWYNNYSKFRYWSYSNGYKDNLSLDRKDNDRGYSPDNCRWVKRNKQNWNKSNNVVTKDIVDFIKKSKLPRIELVKKLGVNYKVISDIKNGVTWGDKTEIVKSKKTKRSYNHKYYDKYKKHGYYKKYPKLTQAYNGILDRTERSKAPGAIKNYQEKGIKMCKEWRDDRVRFYEWSLKNGYKDGLTIDRKDNSKGYSPDNCRWVDIKTQNRNKSNVKLDLQKVKEIRQSNLPAYKLAEKYNVSAACILNVINNRTWV